MVSIPFKRESVSELLTEKDSARQSSYVFQFPSNGKAYLNDFLREMNIAIGDGTDKFQFPSNGKAYLNRNTNIGLMPKRDCVSIPFKRESVSEPKNERIANAAEVNVSIPFKRESVSERELPKELTLCIS